jgi:hypothetical protein
MSDEEERAVVLGLLSTGCLLISMINQQVSTSQTYLLLESTEGWDGQEYSADHAYKLTDLLAGIVSVDDSAIEHIFNKGITLSKKAKLHIIKTCITYALLGGWNTEKEMRLIGRFSRAIGISASQAEALVTSAIEDTGVCQVMAFMEGVEKCHTILQAAILRTEPRFSF